jgi:ABC-type Mn2+/Zn2+ transport system ATPase subunit
MAQVSFNSKADEGQRIQQLSGGQKSLVALATGMFSSFCLKERTGSSS